MSQVKWQWPDDLSEADTFNLWLQERGITLREWQRLAAWFILDQPQAAGKSFLIALLHRYESEKEKTLVERLEENRASIQTAIDELGQGQHKDACACGPEGMCGFHAQTLSRLQLATKHLDYAISRLTIPF